MHENDIHLAATNGRVYLRQPVPTDLANFGNAAGGCCLETQRHPLASASMKHRYQGRYRSLEHTIMIIYAEGFYSQDGIITSRNVDDLEIYMC